MNAYGISVCIVNTHLTPHDHLLADRISDYNTIVTDHTFTAPDTSKILYHEYEYQNIYHIIQIESSMSCNDSNVYFLLVIYFGSGT